MSFYDDYLKAIKYAQGHKSKYPCNALKELDKFLEQCDKCKKQSDALALQKKVDGVFKKAKAELEKSLEPFEKSPYIEKDHPTIVGLKKLEKAIAAKEKPTDKELDDMLEKLP